MQGPSDARDARGSTPADGADDSSIVPGLAEPVSPRREDPGLRRLQPLDMSKDPDRFDAERLDPVQQPMVVGPLDLSKDPDRVPEPSRAAARA